MRGAAAAVAAPEARRGGRRSLEERRAVVAAYHNRGTKSVEAIADRAGVTATTVYQWVKQEREGTLQEPPEEPAAAAPKGKRQAAFPREVRAEAVSRYLADRSQAGVIASALGITKNKLWKWASVAKASDSTALAKANGRSLARGKRALHAVEISDPHPMIALDQHPAMITQELLRERSKTAKLKNMLIAMIQEM